MKNFSPDGYSVPEVAQILGCTPATVRNKIEKGQLKACMSSDKIQKGSKRRIRITRSQLVEYMKMKKSLYGDSEIFRKLCGLSSEENETCSTETAIDEAPEYTVHDISELCGAWAPEKLEDSSNNVADSATDVDTIAQTASCSLLIDGRISLGNVQRDTIKTIISALLSDRNFSPKEITIQLN